MSRSTDLKFTPLSESDGDEVIRIFNYYIEHSDAAFFDDPIPPAFFGQIRALVGDYPSVAVRDGNNTLVGFGILRSHSPLSAFRHTADITYFVRPGRTGAGIGQKMLAYLEEEGRKAGISCILTEISSRNEGSIRFHLKNGFRECGRFINAGKKDGRFFDTVWLQKEI
jgi:L-amino acid N-acyltransferase YncA